jgi:hypothetical protein
MQETLIVLPQQARSPGVYVSNAMFVGVESTYVMAVADGRENWVDFGVNETVVELGIEINVDGEWRVLAAVTTDGKPSVDRNGNVQTATTVRCRLPRSRVPIPQVRAVLQCNSPCEGAVSFVFDDTPLPLQVRQEHHSVTYDSDNEAVATAASSVTVGAFTIAGNADRCLLVGLTTDDASNAADTVVSSITHNSSTAGWASVVIQAHPDAAPTKGQIWRKIAPSAVSSTVAVAMAGACSALGAHALSVYGVHQTTPIGTAVSTTGHGASLTSTSVDVTAVTGDLVYDVVYLFGDAVAGIVTGTAGASQTQRANNLVLNYPPYGNQLILASTEPGVTTTTMSWAISNGGDTWIIHAACPIKTAAVLYTTTVAGVVTEVGTLVKQVNKILLGVITPSGLLGKRVDKGVSGSIALSGILTSAGLYSVLLSGAVVISGVVVKRVDKVVSGVLTVSGVVIRQGGKVLNGVLPVNGVVSKQGMKVVSGVLNGVGSLTVTAIRAVIVGGVISAVGSIVSLFVEGGGVVGGKPFILFRRRKK